MGTANDKVRSMKDQAEGFAKLAQEFGKSMGKAGKEIGDSYAELGVQTAKAFKSLSVEEDGKPESRPSLQHGRGACMMRLGA